MSDLRFERLDVSSDLDRASYERLFYAAFQRAVGNKLIRELWIWSDGAGRLRTRVPYDEQIIYVLRDSAARIVTALAVNCELRSFQSAAFGFAAPPVRRGCCELLAVSAVGEHRLKTRFQFWRDAIADLSANGFHTAYATTARRALKAYLRLRADVLDEREIAGEKRYFLKFNL